MQRPVNKINTTIASISISKGMAASPATEYNGSTITLHDFPFNELEKGRILFQNWTGFLEYENPLTGEDIITRQHEADANAADQAAAYAAQQEQWAQQQQWAAQQQQQQQYVAPAQNNDAGCVGDPSLVW